MTNTRLAVGLPLAALSAAAFGLSGPLGKSLIESGWSSEAAVLARIAGGALILLVPTLVLIQRAGLIVLRTHARLLVAYGVIAIAGAQVAFFSAVRTLPVAIALLIEYLGPVLVVLWLWLRRGERPSRLTVVGGMIAIGGMFFVLDLSGGFSLDLGGVLWALLAAVCLAGYFILSAEQHDDLSPILTVGVGMIVASGTILAAAATGLLTLNAAATEVVLAGSSVPWWVPVAGLVLIAAVLSYLTGILATQRLGSRLASFVALIEVLFSVLFAWWLLAELPRSIQLLGGLLIVTGVLLVRLGEPSLPELEQADGAEALP